MGASRKGYIYAERCTPTASAHDRFVQAISSSPALQAELEELVAYEVARLGRPLTQSEHQFAERLVVLTE